MDSDPQLSALDATALTPLVQQALQDRTAEILTWHHTPIPYTIYLPDRTLARFSGTARLQGVTMPWSIVLKQTRPPQTPGRTSDAAWQREVQAYRSGLLASLPGRLTAPRVFAIWEDDGETHWLWMEEVIDQFGHHWPLAHYGMAARHVGQFNGAYLVHRPLPSYPWLLPAWIDHQSEPWKIPTALPQVEALAADVRVRRAFSVPIADLAPQLLRDIPLFSAILGKLPSVLCHHDAAQANLFARLAANGGAETVAIDWESIGRGTVGADIATLVFGTTRRGDVSAAHLAELDQEVYAGYLTGLHDVGWRGDPQIIRLGYTASIALRWSQLRTTLRAVTGDVTLILHGRAMTESRGEALQQFIHLSEFLLVCAAEARQLAQRLVLVP